MGLALAQFGMAGWPYDPPKGGRSEHHRQHTNKASFNQGSRITWPGYSERRRRVRHDRDRKRTPYQEAKESIRKRRSSDTPKHYQMQRKENGNTNSEHDEIRYCQSIEGVLDGIDCLQIPLYERAATRRIGHCLCANLAGSRRTKRTTRQGRPHLAQTSFWASAGAGDISAAAWRARVDRRRPPRR